MIVLTLEEGLPLPQVGHGLWVDRLDDLAEIETVLDHLTPGHLDLLVDLRGEGRVAALSRAIALCQRRGIDAWLLVIVEDTQAETQLRSLLGHVEGCRGLLALPAAYLESYQPDAVWPSGPTPSDLACLARALFPGLAIGAGMATYFTEVNRCRPATGSFDYLTHALSPTVHAADDRSVMQTLEALPDLFRSARQIAAGQPYRLTTCAIGAWRNPYGGQLTDNPAGERIALSDRDPRQRGLFAAAWTLGLYAAAQRGGVRACALWALHQPFALAEAGAWWPLFHLLRGLGAGQGHVALQLGDADAVVQGIGWRDPAQPGRVRLWLANLGDATHSIEIAGLRCTGLRSLDADAYPDALADPHFLQHTFAPPDTGPLQMSAYALMVVDGYFNA
jgi:hypothetical protein